MKPKTATQSPNKALKINCVFQVTRPFPAIDTDPTVYKISS